ncbi:hypothetical protein ACHAW5_006375 [Stephanodiscus triporus]|uniref:DUF1995 domain-containing protein n=1 Tax=Stephanodiscus triporus TaxID=2934178 RepID=A0ABD3MHI9_9STRA
MMEETNDDDDDDGYGSFLDEDGAVVAIDDDDDDDDDEGEGGSVEPRVDEEERRRMAEREVELLGIIANEGKSAVEDDAWTGPKVRVYFPDEGSAALARRDWTSTVPRGRIRRAAACRHRTYRTTPRILFCCPARANRDVERILYEMESYRGDGLLMSIMLNPLLVDMGVTGFGMAGRRLRERLIDKSRAAYYLRTCRGALTRAWPRLFTVWKEDESAEGGTP